METPSDIEKQKYDRNTLIAAATIVHRNGFRNHTLSKDTRRSQNERDARALVSKHCGDLATVILSLDGSTDAEVKTMTAAILGEIANVESPQNKLKVVQ